MRSSRVLMTLPPVVSPAWLKQRIGQKGLVILDGTWHMPGSPFRLPEGELPAVERFQGERIPGAKFFDIDAITDPTAAPSTPHNLPTPERFAEEMARLGATTESDIVCYDTIGVFSSPRVWWTLRARGCKSVAVLDGGLPGWLREGGQLETGTPPASAPAGKSEWEGQDGVQWRLKDILENLKTHKHTVIDARSPGRFAGTEPEPRPGLRGGHIPGSRSLPFIELICKGDDGVWRLRGEDELRAAFQKAGIGAAEEGLVVTCGSGLTSGHIALAHKVLNLSRPTLSIYDGSWTEYGGREDTEVATGPPTEPKL
eukprot:Hpha_TRINITY_DN149_c0_g1::TRINITY_DN149_c0_g1_i1::g.82185::m.82185/K01011/TST, MPST, sseA; thiosulfate/3-mercaptopyruvate sulfurtransferase